MHSNTFDKENCLKMRHLCVRSHVAPLYFQEINFLQSDAEKDRDPGMCTVRNADVAPELKSHSSMHPRFASIPLPLCVTHSDSC